MKSILVLLLAGICGACNRTPRPQDSGRVPDSSLTVTPPQFQAPALPKGCKVGAPPSTPEELKACVDSLQFDSVEVAGDQQRLMLTPPCPGTCRYGPLATIQPEKSSHLYSKEELREGRIIARMFLGRDERGYGKLGMVPGQMTYWWVQKTSDKPDSAGRSVYLTLSQGRVRPKEFVLQYDEYRDGLKQALARWLWIPGDEKTEGTCGSGTCK